MHRSVLEDTIVALSTPIGEGGIGIVRLSGPASLAIADAVFVSKDGGKPSGYESYTVHYGHVVDRVSGIGYRVSGLRKNRTKPETRNPKPAIIDEALLTVMRAPKSYTREDIVEINCHGGIQAMKKVLDLVARRGARIAEPGEFTKRAFLNGRIDLVQAEAVIDVIRAKTEGSLKVAVSQLEGELSKTVNRALDEVVSIAAHVEASIDFPDEALDAAERRALLKKTKTVITELSRLIRTYDEGAVLREGILAIICGKPNVGKSSLMNLLLKRDRVIVSPIPGTTRDTVEEMINLRGIPIRLVDTAGIAESEDILVREGISRSKKYLALADIVIMMFDHSEKLDAADLALVKLMQNKKTVVVLNKVDLPRKVDLKRLRVLFKKERIVEVSVGTKKNIEALEEAIAGAVWGGTFWQGEGAILSNARHKGLLDKSFENMLSVKRALEDALDPELVAVDLKEAIFNLGLITGRSVSDDVLDRIFEQFCIGK